MVLKKLVKLLKRSQLIIVDEFLPCQRLLLTDVFFGFLRFGCSGH